MKILALIPARKHSLRLPKKNVRILNKKSLIEWSIDSVKNIKYICDILVSTDDEKAAHISKKAGVLVPWKRPKILSNKNASVVDVIIHALDWYENNISKVDGVLLLQPTSPFRRSKIINKGLNLFKKNNFKKVLGVSKEKYNPFLSFKLKKKKLLPIFNKKILKNHSNLKNIYRVNGSFYLISPKELRRTRSFFINSAIPLEIVSKKETVDIDDIWDFRVAEKYLNFRF